MNPDEPSAPTARSSDAARRPVIPSNVTPREVIDDLSETARSVAIAERPYHDHANAAPAMEVTFELPGGFNMGTKILDGALILLHIGSMQHDQQGKGYGTAVLQRAVKYAADRDLRFFANEYLPPDVHRLVNAMTRKGYVARIDPWSNWAVDREPSVEFGTTAASFSELS
jgi:GNAT superfamily N-acetyltransferase